MNQTTFETTYIPVEKQYASLQNVLQAALSQAKDGKGKERHAKKDEPFEQQKICEIARRVGLGYPLGQAVKKAMESERLPYPRNIAEIHGAINYLAAAAIIMEENSKEASSMISSDRIVADTIFFGARA